MHLRTPEEIGLLVREERQNRRWDQSELAKRVGVSRKWIVDLEKGKPTLQIGLVLRTLNTLGRPLSVAIGGKNSGIDLDEILSSFGQRP